MFSHLGKVFTGVTVPPGIDMMLDFESGSSLRFGGGARVVRGGGAGRGIERRGRGNQVQDVGVTPLSLVSSQGFVMVTINPPVVILATLVKTLAASFQSPMRLS